MNTEEIFRQVFGAGWPGDEKLVDFARKRHGFTGDDGYYGVTYPSDLDGYQIEVEGAFIENGHVEISYWDSAFKTLHVTELAYLEALKAHLESKGKMALALVVQAEIHRPRSADAR